MNSNLKTRILTAILGLPLIIGLIFFGGIAGVAFLAWVISVGMWLEYSRLFLTLPDRKWKQGFVLFFNTLIFGLEVLSGSGLSHAFLGLFPVMASFIVFLLLAPRLVRTIDETNHDATVAVLRRQVQELMAVSFGFVYCTWLPLLFIGLRRHDQGVHWVMLMLITVWATDTGAYFVGKKFGNTRLFPVASPKKSWEGAIGGTLMAIAASLYYASELLPRQKTWPLVGVILLASVVSQLGDLCESLLKRAADVKDSGGMIPGHGGFLDRFDGVVFAAPIFHVFAWIFSGY